MGKKNDPSLYIPVDHASIRAREVLVKSLVVTNDNLEKAPAREQSHKFEQTSSFG